MTAGVLTRERLMPLRDYDDAYEFLQYLQKSHAQDFAGMAAELWVVLEGKDRRHFIGCYKQSLLQALAHYEIHVEEREGKMYFIEQDRRILLDVLPRFLE